MANKISGKKFQNTNFAKLLTNSPGKINTILTQIDLVNSYLIAYGIQLDGASFGLPGNKDQCARHSEEYSAYGIAEKNQNFIEYQDETAQGQTDWKNESGFKGETWKANGFTLIHGELSHGKQKVSLIDWDDTSSLNQDHFDLIEHAGQKNVPVFLLTVCVKSRLTEFLAKQKKRFGLRAYRNDKSLSGLSNPVSEICQAAVIQHAKKCGYDVVCIPYKGISPMLSFVLTKIQDKKAKKAA